MPFAQHHYPFNSNELKSPNFFGESSSKEAANHGPRRTGGVRQGSSAAADAAGGSSADGIADTVSEQVSAAKNVWVHPADFIVEYIGQVRGWFYTLHVLATALWDEPAFKNCISHGVILGADGRKMSKRLGNYPDLQLVFDTYGADALRLYLFESPVINGETIAVDETAMRDAQRNIVMTLWNSFQFFITYARLDKWQPAKELAEPKSDHLLDRWLLARLNQVITEVTVQADRYDIPRAVKPLRPFIDDLSNWYIRRSRRRFWKSENDQDKQAAYATLHYILVRTSQLLAPWAPFLSDKLWRDLQPGTNLPKSVHLSDWPLVRRSSGEGGSVKKPDSASQKLLEEMALVREQVITEGLAQRAAAGVKVRQPLASVTVGLKLAKPADFSDMIAEELNVKEVKWVKGGKSVEIDTELTPELTNEGLARDLIRSVQNARKNAGFKVEDRIALKVDAADPAITEVLEAFKSKIYEETLTKKALEGVAEYSEQVKLDGQAVTIGLKRL